MNRIDLTALASLQDYLLRKPESQETRPFGPDALVYKVVGKMFALVAWEEEPLRISLKCDPNVAEMLRQTYPAVSPGYHLNKRHWNTVLLDGSIDSEEIAEMIDASYALVVKGLRKVDRERLMKMDT